MSYNMNYDIDTATGLALAQFNAPASTVLLYEDKRGNTGDPTTPTNAAGPVSDWANDAAYRHDPAAASGGTQAENYLLFDGHVKYLKVASVSFSGQMTMPAGNICISPCTTLPANLGTTGQVATLQYQ